MTVAELIAQLQVFDPTLTVGYPDHLIWNPREICEVYQDEFTWGTLTRNPKTKSMIVLSAGSEGL